MIDYEIIKYPLVTEKATAGQGEDARYAFCVDQRATKPSIKRAIERLFKVHVTSVNVCVMRGKNKRVGNRYGRKSNWKKAYISLKQGEKIELFEGV